MLKCTACGGTYQPTNADGSAYFHRCPPLSLAELTAAVAANKIALPVDPITKVAETPDVAITRRSYERANLRDENLQATSGAGAKLMKATGDGTTTLADPAPATVSVPK